MRMKTCTTLVTLICLLYAAQARADCTITAQSLSFGQYDVFDEAPTESVGNIIIDCMSSTSYTLILSSGSGNYTERHLTGNSSVLLYNLYVDAAYSQVWGDASGGSATISGTAEGTASHDVYGLIPARQNITPGMYGDTITVTIEF